MVSVTQGAERVRTALAALRGRRPLLDRAVLTLERYTAVKGNLMAGGVTYFGVLSFFPVMALAFFAVGYLVRLFPQADDALTTAIEQLFPGMFGSGSEQLSLADLEQLAGTLGVIGVLGALYAGLGWLSAMRTSLLTVFDLAEEEQPNFLLGKARDLATLVAVGVTLLLSVSVSGLVSRYAQELLEWVGLGGQPQLADDPALPDRRGGLGGPAVLPDVHAAGPAAHPGAIAVARRTAGRGGLRGPQAAGLLAARLHRRRAGLPGCSGSP